MNFNRSLEWLRQAIKLQGAVPENLDTDFVQATIEVGQDGWPHHTESWFNNSVSDGGLVLTVAEASPDWSTMVLFGQSQKTGTGLGAIASVSLIVDTNGGPNSAMIWTNPWVETAEGIRAWSDMTAGGRPIWVPPGLRLQISLSAAGGSEIEVTLLTVRLPAGFSPPVNA